MSHKYPMTDTQRVAIHYTPTPYPGIPLASFWIFWLLCQNEEKSEKKNIKKRQGNGEMRKEQN